MQLGSTMVLLYKVARVAVVIGAVRYSIAGIHWHRPPTAKVYTI